MAVRSRDCSSGCCASRSRASCLTSSFTRRLAQAMRPMPRGSAAAMKNHRWGSSSSAAKTSARIAQPQRPTSARCAWSTSWTFRWKMGCMGGFNAAEQTNLHWRPIICCGTTGRACVWLGRRVVEVCWWVDWRRQPRRRRLRVLSHSGASAGRSGWSGQRGGASTWDH